MRKGSLSLQWFALAASALVVLIMLFLVVWLRPGYGTMDDGWQLRLCDLRQEQGLPLAFLEVMRGDLRWGMFRPLYYLYTQLVYCPTDGSPAALYFVNVLVVAATTLAFGAASYRILPLRSWPLRLYLPAFFLLSVAVYRFHDLIFSPSLQEKLVIMAGAFALAVVAGRGKEGGCRALIWDSCLIALVLFLGFASKAQFILFLPGLLLLLLANEWEGRKRVTVPFARAGLLAVLGLAGMLALWKFAGEGSYTSRYSFAKMPENLLTRQGIMLVSLGLLSLVLELRFARAGRTGLPGYARALVPASFLLAFLVIMAPWAIGDSYIMSPAAFLAAFCLLSLLQRLPLSLAWLVVVPAAALALTLTAYREYRGFGRWADLQYLLFSAKLEERVRGPHLAFIPCMEGADLSQFYLKRYRDLELVQRSALKEGERPTMAIADSALCPLPGEWKVRARRVTEPRFEGSFALYDL